VDYKKLPDTATLRGIEAGVRYAKYVQHRQALERAARGFRLPDFVTVDYIWTVPVLGIGPSFGGGFTLTRHGRILVTLQTGIGVPGGTLGVRGRLDRSIPAGER
jgi:hypothetical protein